MQKREQTSERMRVWRPRSTLRKYTAEFTHNDRDRLGTGQTQDRLRLFSTSPLAICIRCRGAGFPRDEKAKSQSSSVIC